MNRTDLDRMFVIIFIFVALTFILLYRWIKIKERGEGAGGAGGANLDPGGGGMSADPGRGGGAEAAGGELGFVWRRRFYAITALALFLRIAFASAIEGFPSDIMCFKGWSQAAAENFFTLYDRGADWFIDYPPGYMYVLLVIGKIREIFQIPSESGLYTLLVKLPSILADVLSGMLLYALAGLGQNAAPREGGGLARRIGGHAVGGLTADGHTVVAGLSERTRLLITAFYYFNPVVFFISTIWGQVDSIMTLLILAAVLCLLRGRHCASGVFYALSVLLKPQGIIFLPVAFFLLLHGLITRGDWRAPLKTALGAIATAVVVTLPFELRHGADWVINLYSNTLSGYKLASMNAFNFFALIGGNWKDDSETLFLFSYATWGMLAIVFFTALTGLFVFRMRAQKTVPDCYTMLMGSALLLFSVVTFGHRMHERYFFPVILLQLAAGLFYESGGDSGESGRARRPGGFGGFGGLGGALLSHAWITLSGFLNVLFVFSAFYTNSSSAFYENAWIYVISALNVSAAVFLWIHAFRRMKRGGGLLDSLRERRGAAPRTVVPRGAGRRRAVSLAITVALLFSGLVFLAPPARVYAQGNVASVNAAAASLVAVNAVAAGDAAGSAISGEPAEVRNPGFEEDILSDPRTAGVHGWNLYDYRDQQANEPGTSTLSYDTEFYRSGAASFRIDSIRINDVRLYQKVPVRPDSIYRISCWVAADAVSDDGVGANVSVIGLFSMSEDVKEDRDGGFSLVELYGRTGPKQEELEISVGLGGYSNESFGTAWFDDVSVERFDAAPPGAEINNFFAEDSGGQSDGAQPNEMPAPVRFVLMCAALLLLGLVVSIAIRGGGGAPGMASDSAPAQSPAAVAPAVTGGTHGAAWGAAFRLDRRDAVIMAAMTAVYLVIAFIRLGGFSAPQTYWKPVEDTDSIVFDLGGAAKIQKVLYNCNALQHNEYESAFELFALSAGEAGATGADAAAETETATLLCRLDDKAFYEWKSVGVVGEAARLRLDAVTPGMSLNEIAFYGVDASGKEGLLPVTIAQSSVSDHDVGEPRFLIDEQDTVPERPDILNGTYFDEIYFARTAYEHIHSLPIYETTHPPLGKLVTALGILIFGMNPFGWRIMGMLAGAAMIPVMYLFGKRLFGGRAFAFCAAFLMMFDFMHFAQTRLSTIDSYATLLILLMYLFMLDSFMHGISGRGPRDVLIPLGLSGLAFGLGASVKWIALYGGLGIAFLFFVARAREIRGVFGFDTGSASAQPQGQPSHAGSRSGSGSGRARSGSNSGSGRTHSRSYTRSRFRARSRGAAARAGERAYLSRLGVVLCASLVFFVLVPGLIYLLSYIPYTQVPGEQGGLFKVMMDNQASMLDYHSKLTDTHPFESVWWSWPLNIKPIWYYSASGLPAALKASVASFGNPLIWWVGIPCLIAAFYLAYRKGDRHMAVVFAAFLFQYCPWIFISRATFIYHYFSSAPFVIFAIVYVLKALVEAKVVTFRAVGLYLTAVAALFVFYYPVLSGLPVAKSYADALRLFSSWLW